MARSNRSNPFRRQPTWTWRPVRVFVKCIFGCDIPAHRMAAFGPRRCVLCEPCAKKHYGLEPREDERPRWKGLEGRDKQLPEHDQ